MAPVSGQPAAERPSAIAVGLYLVGVAFIARALYRGVTFFQGDFYFTWPGEYAGRVNPALWSSPDLKPSLDFNHGAYLYGPSQYLTLYPLVYFDSYRTVALVLLAAYLLVLLATWYTLWKLVMFGEPDRRPVLKAGLFAAMFAFLPLTQALIQREFEVVAFLLLVGACLLQVRGREAASGATVAFLTWFKYWPLVILGGFVLHRRRRGILAFVMASAAILLAAQLVFGLQHFVIAKTLGTVGGLVRPLGSGEVLFPVIPQGARKSDFCRQWVWGRGTQADIRWALCGLEYRVPAFSAKAAFFALVTATAVLFLWGAYRLESASLTAAVSKWATIWEFSILTIVGSAFVHAHYYYFIVFLLPLTALLFSYGTDARSWRKTKLVVWTITYVLLNAFMIPTSWLSDLLKTDSWALYLDGGWCLLGTLMLLALVLWEFMRLTVRAPRALAAV